VDHIVDPTVAVVDPVMVAVDPVMVAAMAAVDLGVKTPLQNEV